MGGGRYERVDCMTSSDIDEESMSNWYVKVLLHCTMFRVGNIA